MLFGHTVAVSQGQTGVGKPAFSAMPHACSFAKHRTLVSSRGPLAFWWLFHKGDCVFAPVTHGTAQHRGQSLRIAFLLFDGSPTTCCPKA